MQVRNLQHISLVELTTVFNHSFADYVIKMELSEEAMAKKIKAENIQLSLSAGGFVEDHLVAFILLATGQINGQHVVYNAGTGVLPAYRGNKFTSQLYAHSVHQLRNLSFYKHLLEVLCDNLVAISVYKGVGFVNTRKVSCYKAPVCPAKETIGLVQNVEVNESVFRSFYDIEPSWQNSLMCIQRLPDDHRVVGLHADNELVAYAIYIPATGRLKQLAVHPNHRKKGYGTQLLFHVHNNVSAAEVVITGVEENEGIHRFLIKAGMQSFVAMYEMEMTVK